MRQSGRDTDKLKMDALKRLASMLIAIALLCQLVVAAFANHSNTLALVQCPDIESVPKLGKKAAFALRTPCAVWTDPKAPPWAAVLCVHGFGLNSQSFGALGQHLAALGIETYAIDVRGFGSWANAKGHESVNFQAALLDVKNTLQSIRHAHPDLPVYLLGESMGGAMVLQAAALFPDQIDGVVASVPSPSRYQQKTTSVKVAVHLVAKNRPMNMSKTVVQKATDDPELQSLWDTDPMMRTIVKPTELVSFQRFMNQTKKSVKAIDDTPVLIVQGTQDKLVKPTGTVELFHNIASDDKDLVMTDCAQHLIFEEGRLDNHVLDVLLCWLEEHADKDDQIGTKEQSSDEIPERESAAEHLRLAKTYLVLKNHKKAKLHCHNVIKLARQAKNVRGAKQAENQKLVEAADEIMLHLPRKLVAPHVGHSTGEIARKLGIAHLAGHAGDITKPTVVTFSAPWCVPCKGLAQAVQKLKSEYGSKIDVIDVNVDNPKNYKIVDAYGVGPIPTVLFLDEHGEVVFYTIGFAGDEVLEARVERLLNES